jgi:hypothetical protein
MGIRLTGGSGGLKKVVVLLFLYVSLLMSNWANAGSSLQGDGQIQPYETEQGRTNLPEPSYQEYTPPPTTERWVNNAQDVNQSEADRVASQKASEVDVAEAAQQKQQ